MDYSHDFERDKMAGLLFHSLKEVANTKLLAEPPAWMTERAETEYLAWRDAAMVNWLADRDDWERGYS